MLRRWTALVLYFDAESKLHKEEAAEKISEILDDPLSELYTKFLYYILDKFSKVNEKMQSVTPILSTDRDPMADLYFEVLRLYISQKHLMDTELSDIDPSDKKFMKEPGDINVGMECLQLLHKTDSKITVQEREQFFKDCQQYLITACTELKKKCNYFRDKQISERYILHPENALNKRFHECDECYLDGLMEAFPQFACNSEKIREQWGLLMKKNFPSEVTEEKKVDIFWSKILNYSKENNNCFVELCDFALSVLLLPNSNASSERVWSKLNLEKTALRNRLHFETVQAILFSAQYGKHLRETKDINGISDEMIISAINTTATQERKIIPKKDPDLIACIDAVQHDHTYCIDVLKKCASEERTYGIKRKPKINYLNKGNKMNFNADKSKLLTTHRNIEKKARLKLNCIPETIENKSVDIVKNFLDLRSFLLTCDIVKDKPLILSKKNVLQQNLSLLDCKGNFSFTSDEQQDASEFIQRFLHHYKGSLEIYDEEILMDNLFVKFTQYTKCEKCNLSKESHDFEENILFFTFPTTKKDSTTHFNICDFFNTYMHDTRKQRCSKCKEDVQHSIENKVKHFPTFLFLTVKRTTFEGDKIFDQVEILREINLNVYKKIDNSSNAIYFLKSGISHHGKTIREGHYSAFINVENSWYHASDDTVKIKEFEMLESVIENDGTTAAYVTDTKIIVSIVKFSLEQNFKNLRKDYKWCGHRVQILCYKNWLLTDNRFLNISIDVIV
uniref:USP domain-containing protein n=1 Tax=Trichogramma kaykai TaxID=54128 RepID=A0ABD2X1F4_9HYME